MHELRLSSVLIPLLALVAGGATALGGAPKYTGATALSGAPKYTGATALSGAPKYTGATALGAVGTQLPEGATAREFAGSGRCFGCHAAAYTSWKSSYHASMTATPERKNLLPFREPVRENSIDLPDGSSLTLRGDRLFANPVESAVADGRPATEEVPFVTGRHRYQVYWLPDRDRWGSKNGQFRPFPWVYLPRSRADGFGDLFVPRASAFVTPPDVPPTKVHWTSNCIQCHTTNFAPGAADPKPSSWLGASEADYAPTVSEFGIACEACHGAAKAHAEEMQNPFTRWNESAVHAEENPVNPRKLSPERSAELCGRCHALTLPKDEARWFRSGYQEVERPGDPLTKARVLLTPDTANATVNVGLSNFFDDAKRLRVTGREYQALVASPCFSRGHANEGHAEDRTITCTDCHQMHAKTVQMDGERDGDLASWADRQLRFAESDEACLQCHTQGYQKVSAHGGEARPPARGSHSLHAGDSPGARCMNCHMPKRVYGLLGVRRSHQIEGDPAAEIAGTPSACMLCHLDMPSRTGERFSLAEGARTGDAATRVLVAGVLGLPEVRDATRASWGFEAPLFEALQNDPYAAVRIVARRSLDARPDLPQIPRRDPLAPPTPDAVPRDMRPITLSE